MCFVVKCARDSVNSHPEPCLEPLGLEDLNNQQPVQPIWLAMIAYEPASISPTCAKSSLKRKAESDHHVRSSQIDSTRPPRLTSPTASLNVTNSPPEPNSINAIIREHCRRRLYVRPLLWTLEQLILLGCEFISKTMPPGGRCKRTESAELDDDSPRLAKTTDAIYGHAVRAASQLCKPCALETRNSAVRQLLAACKFEYLG